MENNAFTRPQRQSEIGIALLTILNFGKLLRNFWPLLIIYLFRDKTAGGILFAASLIGLVLLFFIIVSYFQYRNFTYFIDKNTDEFIIDSGIVTKKRMRIEKNKIQEININQPFIHKLFNIFQLEIDSPGTDKKEITVNAISYHNASQLKAYLLKNSTAEIVAESAKKVYVGEKSADLNISLGSLIKYGLTANYSRSFLTVIAFAFYLFQQAADFLKGNIFLETAGNTDFLENYLNEFTFNTVPILLIIGIILAIFIIGILISVIMTVIRHYGMRIKKTQTHLSLQYGLFNSKNSILNPQKVQIICEVQNTLQKKLDTLHLKFKQISDNEVNRGSYVLIPGCNEKEKNALLNYFWGVLPVFNHFLKPNIRKLIINNLFFIALPVFISILASSFLGSYFLLIVPYVLITAVLLVRSFNNSKLYYNENFIRVQAGIWDIEKKTTEIHRIHSVKISQYFWQRKSDLGFVKFYTAGGTLSFGSTNFSLLKKLVNYAVYHVENSKKDWI